MTINDFVTSMVKEVEEIVKDLSFLDIREEAARMKGYPYELPVRAVQAGWDTAEEAQNEEELFPYFLVQVDEINYEDEEAQAKVWILFAVYDSSQEMEGWKTITTAVERVINRFRVNPVLEDYYYCERKMKAAYPDTGDWPHFFAGVEMTWHLPVLEPEF